MRKTLTTCCLFFLIANAYSQKFYFPNKLYSDSAALAKAMPALAKQVIANYKKFNNPFYFVALSHYQIVEQEYNGAIESINAFRNRAIPGRKGLFFKYEIYALVKEEQKTDNRAFDVMYKNKFMSLYDQLPAKDRYEAMYPYTTNIKQYSERLQKLTDKLKQKNRDSIGLGDARKLCLLYCDHKFNCETLPSAKTWLVKLENGLENKNFPLHADKQYFLAENPPERHTTGGRQTGKKIRCRA